MRATSCGWRGRAEPASPGSRARSAGSSPGTGPTRSCSTWMRCAGSTPRPPSPTTTWWWPAPGAGTCGRCWWAGGCSRRTAGRCTSTWTRSAPRWRHPPTRRCGRSTRPASSCCSGCGRGCCGIRRRLKEGSHVREARIDETTEGRLPAGEGWFILNLGEMPWETVPASGCGATSTGPGYPAPMRPSVSTSTSCSPGRPTATTTPKPPTKGSSCSAASVWRWWRARSGRCGSGTSSIHRREPLTSRSEPATDRA